MSRYSINTSIYLDSTTDDSTILVDGRSTTELLTSIEDPGPFLESEESIESVDIKPAQYQDDVKNPAFFKLWTNIPTIEQFMKPSKYRDESVPDDEAEEGEMEDFSSRGIESKDDDLLSEKKEEELMMDEEEASEQPPTTEHTEKTEIAEEEESEEEDESESSEDFQLPDYDDEAIEQSLARSLQLSAATALEELKELAPSRMTKDDVYKRGRYSVTDLTQQEKYFKTLIIQDILNDTVNKVVDACEKVNITTLYQVNLDKRKLIRALLTAHEKYTFEIKLLEALNKKVVEYCRRKKLIRYLTIDNLKTLEFEKGKLSSNMKRLDCLLKMRSEISVHINRVDVKLHKELEYMKKKALAEVDRFEAYVKETCHIETRSKNLLELTNNKFAAMAQIRNKISKLRYQLILKLDSKANLTDQLERIQNIGGFSTVKYDAVSNEIRQIQEKIDEKTAEHRREARRVNEKIGKIVHIRDITEISITKLDQSILTYLQLMKELNKMRERKSIAYDVRFDLKKDLKHVKARCGLLDKKPLLLEYDATYIEVQKKRELVRTMSERVNELQARLDQIKECGQISTSTRPSSIRPSSVRPSGNRTISVVRQDLSSILRPSAVPASYSVNSSLKTKETPKDHRSSILKMQTTNIFAARTKPDYTSICSALKRPTVSTVSPVPSVRNVTIERKESDSQVEMTGATKRYLNKIKRVRRFQNYSPSNPSMHALPTTRPINKSGNFMSVSMLTLKSFTNLKGVEDIKYPSIEETWEYKPTFIPL